jgi:hypothetical protein
MSISNRGSLLVVLACLAGCATTYTSSNPANVPPEQFATVEQVDPMGSGMLIDHVDGKWHGFRPARLYQFTPGEHSLSARANLAFYTSNNSEVRWFDAEPGGQYLIQVLSEPATGQWGFGVIDKKSGARVDRLWSRNRHSGGE